ncbi:MAG TPA: C25 family cysteine peptidase [Methylomirabilota bacterium]|nr:C25 family cysteine peptidase [Methylomirabilota bacterium]
MKSALARTLLATWICCALPFVSQASGRIEPADTGDPAPATAPDEGPGDVGKPAPADGPAGMVIVTDASLVAQFRRLASTHERLGLVTRLRTLQSIRDAYPAGRDDAERIRLFLKDARANWGIEFAFMGGDEPLIPMRRAYVDQLPPVTDPVILLPTDQYYACLDGDWNADGDDRWGELPNMVTGDPGDDADVVPELCVGRAPVTTRQQAQEFVDKTVRTLERSMSSDPLDVLLVAGAALGTTFFAPQAEAAKALIDSATAASIARLYRYAASWPGAEPLTEESLLAGLETGPELSVLFGSGGPGTFALEANPPLIEVPAEDLLGLENRDSFGHAVALSAYTTQPGILSIGAALVQARRGGSASVLGPTDIEFVGVSNHYIELYLEKGFVEHAATVGEAMRAVLHEPDLVQPFSILRLTALGNTLLGDPALPFPAGTAPPAAAFAKVSASGPGAWLDAGVTTALTARRPAFSRPDAGRDRARASARLDRATGSLEIAFERPRSAGSLLDVSVIDLSGRRVRQLDRATARAGTGSVSWDLRDADGRRVRPGLYFVRVATGGDQQVVRAVVW